MPTRFLPPLLLVALLAACGQKGPLYLPEPEAAEPVAGTGSGVPATEPAPAPAPDVEQIAPDASLQPAGAEPVGVPGGEAAADADAALPGGELDESRGEGSVRDEL